MNENIIYENMIILLSDFIRNFHKAYNIAQDEIKYWKNKYLELEERVNNDR